MVLISNSTLGYAVISGIVLLAVAIFTVSQLRKQVKNRKKEEQEKDRDKNGL